MSSQKDKITCEEHGESSVTYVCGHICAAKDDEAVGFYQSYIDLYDKEYEFNVWCKACDDRLAQAGNEWNDLLEQQADIKILCFGCFEKHKLKQMMLNPADMIVSYVPDNSNIKQFYDMADAHIELANNKKRVMVEHKSESLLFAAARFASFEATLNSKDVIKYKTKIIEFYTTRFKEMFIDNLNDYIEK